MPGRSTENNLNQFYYRYYFEVCQTLEELSEKAIFAFKDREISSFPYKATAFKQAIMTRAIEIDFDRAEMFVTAIGASLLLVR